MAQAQAERLRKYWDALRKLQFIGQELERKSSKLPDEMELSIQDILDVGQRIVNDSPLRSKVIRMLLANFNATGIGRVDRGTEPMLEKALAAASLRFKYEGGRGISLVLAMPDKMPDYKSKSGKSKTPFYVVAASQNYGAVRMKKVRREIRDVVTGRLHRIEVTDPIGKAAKATLKKILQRRFVSKRALSSLMRGRQIGGMTIKGIDPQKMKESGAAYIQTPAKNFWPLNPAQQKEVTEDFEVLFREEAASLLKRRQTHGS